MLEFLQKFPLVTWHLLAEMAPYLLIGFAAAGLLSVFLPRDRVQQWLGGRGPKAVVRATLVGVPLPVCSCGVIPIAAGLRKQGAGMGPTAAFLASTPQTGVDSVAATWGLMGAGFAWLRVAVAFVSGWLAGLVVGAFSKGAETNREEAEQATGSRCCSEKDSCCQQSNGSHPWRQALRYGFITMPRDLGKPLTLGIVLAGLFATIIPHDFFAADWAQGWLAYLAVTMLAVPLYVCSTGTIPFAYVLVEAGLPAGAALVFLVAGPATNVATLTAMAKVLGRRVIGLYLASILAVSWSAGALFDALGGSISSPGGLSGHFHLSPEWWMEISGVILIAVMAYALWPRRKKTIKTATTTHASTEATEPTGQVYEAGVLKREGVTELRIDGMHCGGCARKVGEAIMSTSGVEGVRVESVSGRTIVYGKKVCQCTLEVAVRQAGFQPYMAESEVA